MSLEAKLEFNSSVKKVEFFPFEWSQNLLAVCLPETVEIYTINPNKMKSENKDELSETLSKDDGENMLNLEMKVPFQSRIDHFSWSPKTNLSTLKPIIEFAVCDNEANLFIITSELDSINKDFSSGFKTQVMKIDADVVFKIAFDYQNGEYIAVTADNMCYLLDCINFCVKTSFLLESIGIDIKWHRDEQSKLMVAEQIGLIRIYSIETFKPIYTLICNNSELESTLILSIDWCQTNPEVVIASTRTEIIFWNTFKSCLPIKRFSSENLKICKLIKFKDDMIGYICGTDSNSKLNILNHRLNQNVYQTQPLKLLNSFSFNVMLPLIAIANEQKLMIINLINK